ncbi:MAG: hypothetical protein CL912_00450 [Deltaproteobacteria bacterium]|nr:hypothetical protein [Deltaproteobacteria bacterium]
MKISPVLAVNDRGSLAVKEMVLGLVRPQTVEMMEAGDICGLCEHRPRCLRTEDSPTKSWKANLSARAV